MDPIFENNPESNFFSGSYAEAIVNPVYLTERMNPTLTAALDVEIREMFENLNNLLSHYAAFEEWSNEHE